MKKPTIDIELLKTLLTQTIIESIANNKDFTIFHDNNGDLSVVDWEYVPKFRSLNPLTNYLVICKVLGNSGEVIMYDKFKKLLTIG